MADLPTGTVTFLYTDLEGSTARWERQPAAMKAAAARHDALMRDAIAAHGGHVFRLAGDGVCAAFATAPDAVAAALAAQRALMAEDWGEAEPLRARMALHTGAAEVHGGDYVGACLNRVGRLLAVGHGGQVLLSQTTADLAQGLLPDGASLRALGEHRLRDLVQPERVYQVLHATLPDAFPALRSLEAYLHNLPLQLTSFVGREAEIAEVTRLLATTRLVTLTGAGGCGKTRLALQVAADLVDAHPDGVWFVDLAPLTDPDLVGRTVAGVLSIVEQPGQAIEATLARVLRQRVLLLVLDNGEHLLDACATLVETLLRGCPGVRILATSRELVGAAGEIAWRVPSLATPDPDHLPPLDQLAELAAVRLFVERARLVQPAFVVTAPQAVAVAQVCRRLDGIPLALELAAARLTALPVEQIAARLDDRFRLLTGGRRTAVRRQQTLAAAIDWSHDLLTEAERIVFRRLAVFTGGWTLEAAEAVAHGEGIAGADILDLLTRLVEKSLVPLDETGADWRYRLLETVRQYAGEQLAASGEAAAVRDRHRDYFLALAEAAYPALAGPEQLAWFERLEREYDNLRAALTWCQADPAGADAELRLAAGLGRFWHLTGHAVEGMAWLAHALDRVDRTPTPALATALSFAGRTAQVLGQEERTRALLEEAVAVARALGDGGRLANALRHLSYTTPVVAERQALLEAAVAVAREAGDQREEGFSLVNLARELVDAQGATATAERLLAAAERPVWAAGDRMVLVMYLTAAGHLALAQGDHPVAIQRLREGLARAREMGVSNALGAMFAPLARAAGDRATAWACAREALTFAHRRGEWGVSTRSMLVVAGLRAEAGALTAAARLFGAAGNSSIGWVGPLVLERRQYEADVAAVRAGLGEAAFAAARAAGQALTLEEAVVEALAEAGADG